MMDEGSRGKWEFYGYGAGSRELQDGRRWRGEMLRRGIKLMSKTSGCAARLEHSGRFWWGAARWPPCRIR